MHKLREFESPVIAAGVMVRLEEASIDAEMTHSPSPELRSWKNVQPTIIWLADETDLPRALQIVEALAAVPIESERCPSCGYDFAGHRQAGACPECGEAFRPPQGDVICPDCGEPGPSDFEVCWSCGGRMPQFPDQASVSRTSGSTSPPVAAWPRALLFVGMVVFGLGILFNGIRSCAGM